MAENDYICGVNWSTMKKIAKFVFGDSNCVSFKKTDNRRYIVFITKKVYYDKKEVVEHFENYWKVSVKPMDIE
jgi:hypothetical protein